MRLMVASAFWLAGVYLGLELELPGPALGMFLVASAALVPIYAIRRWSILVPVALLAILLGALRVELPASSTQVIEPYLGLGSSVVVGTVADDPEPRGNAARFLLAVETIDPGGGAQPVEGKALVLVRPSAALVQERSTPFIRYGDRLRLQGRLETPPVFGDFDYREYLARQGISAIMTYPQTTLLGEGHGSPLLSPVYRLRNALARSLTRSLSEPQASLAQTLLLGRRGDVPADLTQAFRDTGTSHLLAISGLHVGIMLALTLPLSAALLGRRRHLYLLPPLAVLWLYTLLSGFSASVERAVIMASVYLLALALGRQRNPLPALALAAAVMVALEPNALYDVSFQLSFVAVAGIIHLAPPIQRVLVAPLGGADLTRGWRRVISQWLILPATVSLAAIVATLPLLAFNFHRIALLSLPATLLALPALPYALGTSLATGLLGLVSTPLGQTVGVVAWLPLSYVLAVVEGLARFPQTVIQLGDMAGMLVWAYYGAAALVTLSMGLRHDQPGDFLDRVIHWSPRPAVKAGTLLGLGTAVVLVWAASLSLPDGKLRVTFLDVGQGDAILIQGPDGQQALIDGGPDPRRVLSALGERLPFWDRTLDMVILTHANDDHLAGLPEVVRRYRVAVVLDNPFHRDSEGIREWRTVLEEEGVTVVHAHAGHEIRLGDDLILEVLHPPEPLIGGTGSDANNNSTVLRLRYGDASFLLTGDVHLAAELSMIDRGLDLESTVLKVAHHGSDSSTGEELLERVRPKLAVVSVGKENRYGHPREGVLQRLQEAVGQDRVFLTSEHGAVQVTTDGERLWVAAER